MAAKLRLYCWVPLLACALPAAAQTPVTFGHDYSLSKRTDLYSVAMRDRITTLPSAMSYGLGARHSF